MSNRQMNPGGGCCRLGQIATSRFAAAVCSALLSLSLPSTAHAQINVEALRPDRADTGTVGTLGIDFSLRTGNVELVELGLDARVDRQTRKSMSLLLVNGDLGFLEGDRFTNDGLLHVRHGRAIGRMAMVEGYSQLNYDKARLLDSRVLLGGGVRLSLVDADGAGLSLGSGLMFEHETLDLPSDASHPQSTNVWRSSNYLAVRLAAKPRFVFSTTGYAQPSLGDPEDIRLLNQTGLAVAVTGRVSMRVEFELRYDSSPPDGVVGLGAKLANGVAIRF